MQLACSSAVFGHLLSRGELTQLEWIDLAARNLPVDGLVFGFRHFPRRDAEYLAEVRKLCVDRCLTLVALAVDDLFAQEPEGMETLFAFAAALGVPLLLTDPPAADAAVPAYAWRDAAQHGKYAARLAKRANITVAVRNAPGSLCPGAPELKRLTKDVDSSWLRFGPDASLNAEDQAALRPRTVVATVGGMIAPDFDRDRKGFVVAEATDVLWDVAACAEAVRRCARELRVPVGAEPTA